MAHGRRYLLLQTPPDRVVATVELLRTRPDVVDVDRVQGAFDIIVVVTADAAESDVLVAELHAEGLVSRGQSCTVG